MDIQRFLGGCVATAALLLLPAIALAQSPAAHAEKLEEAQALFEEGKHSEAMKAFKEADKLAGGNCLECRLGLVRAFGKLGAHKEVLKNVDALVSMTSDKKVLMVAYHEQGLSLLALSLQDPKQLEPAAKAFRQVLDLSEGKLNAVRFNLGYTLLRMSRDEEGVARKWQVEGYPTYVLVNHEGEIIYVVRGWGEGIEQELSMKLASAIRAAKKAVKVQ